MLPALIGLAHGSRDPRFAATVDALVDAAVTTPIPAGRAAYLELSDPDLETVCRELSRPAVVVPLLFSSAYHAGTDAPQQVSAAARATGVALTLAPVLGLGPDVIEVVAATAQGADIPTDAEVVLVAVGSSDPAANAEVGRFAEHLADLRSRPVHVGFATTSPWAIDVLTAVRARAARVAIVPLFLAPGLLLDKVLQALVAQGLPVSPPLGTAMAPVLRARWALLSEPPRAPIGLDHPA